MLLRNMHWTKRRAGLTGFFCNLRRSVHAPRNRQIPVALGGLKHPVCDIAADNGIVRYMIHWILLEKQSPPPRLALRMLNGYRFEQSSNDDHRRIYAPSHEATLA
jgi:hypothetical protein